MTISGFIAYAIQTWKNKPDTSTPLSAARLAHIEAGIKANSDAITKLAAAVINQQANDVNKIPSSALMYSVNEKVDSAISDLGDVKTDISLQPVTGIDILTLTTGRYYATNCTNLPTGWVAAYLDVERLDNKWCRITAWPPYDGPNSPQITKQDNGTWRGWKDIMDDKISFEGVGKVTFAQNSSATSIRFYTTAINYLYIEFLTATKNIKFGFYNGATWTDYWIM
ncbi:hypothetical protein [Hungatella effluvii]|uniref:hypothetical protein n=1 Tax=Hungatella effluvii TaxID=1096246 RepID=UPI002A833588|nr:hypothetical protein [Hungatella effluvii]